MKQSFINLDIKNTYELQINNLINNAKKFTFSCECKSKDFKLTHNSEASPFAILFAILTLSLLGEDDYLNKNKIIFDKLIRNNLNSLYKKNLTKGIPLEYDKHFLQLLSFSFSCLEVINTLKNDPLSNIVSNVFCTNGVSEYLDIFGTFEGKARSGNMAMFLAVILEHKRKYLSINTSKNIEEWIDLHLQFINKNGFWGNPLFKPYLQFQNGYHQYEILRYFNISGENWKLAANHILKLQDKNYKFAPYPGGGGCFDLDAIFFLTNKFVSGQEYTEFSIKFFNSIIKDQNIDGGFCESKLLEGSSFKRIIKLFAVNHLRPFKYGFNERLFYATRLAHPKHNRINTHWTKYSRSWNESDLWDTWFRLLAIARIDRFLKLGLWNWKFSKYIGLGFEP